VCNRTGPYDPNGECHTRCGSYAEPLYHVPRGWIKGLTHAEGQGGERQAGEGEEGQEEGDERGEGGGGRGGVACGSNRVMSGSEGSHTESNENDLNLVVLWETERGDGLDPSAVKFVSVTE
jgi:hypothetical protein